MIPRSCLAGALVAGLFCPLAVAQTLGAPFTIRSSPAITSVSCDVAYDLTRDIYAVVYERNASGSRSINVQRFRRDGTLVGGEVRVATSSSLIFKPRIANLNLRNRFVVCWQAAGSGPNGTGTGIVMARIVDPASGLMSNAVTVTTTALNYDIGGDATMTDDDVVFVWTSGPRVFARQLAVTSSFQLQLLPQQITIGTTVGAIGTARDVCISPSGGPDGRYLVAWTENSRDIRGAVIHRDLGVLVTGIRIDMSGSERRFVGAVDGDGSNFVITYDKEESPGSGVHDIFARCVAFDPSAPASTVAGQERPIEADGNDDEINPTVAFTGSSALVSYIDQFGNNSDAHAKSVDPFGCGICEPQFALDSGNADFGVLANSIAERAAGANNASALVVWTRSISGGSTTIRGRFYTAEDGIARDLGGGCGTGGETLATCSLPGNSEFTVRLRDATGTNALLVLSPRRIDASCGACMLVPDPVVGSFLSRPIGPTGGASLRLPIPSGSSLVGTRFYAQWMVPGATCAIVPANFSNALEIEIQ